MAVTVTADERQRQVDECVSSGLPVKTWCRENGVASSTMYDWIRRARDGEDRASQAAPATPAFLEVSVASARVVAAPAAGGIVCRIGPAELVIPAGADERDVAVAMRTAAAL